MPRTLTMIITALVAALATGAAFAQTTNEAVDSVARGGVNSLDQRLGAVEGRPTLSGLTCGNGEIAKYNGVAWVCAVDADTSAATQCTGGQVLTGDGNCVTLPSAGGETRFVLVGFTTTALTGGSGIRALSATCHADFSGSRMCTSQEFLEGVYATFSVDEDPKGFWIRPTFVAANVTAGGGSADIIATDMSGVTGHSSNELTCNGWAAGALSSATGLTVTPGTGRFAKGECIGQRRIVCCAPAQ